MRLLQDQRAIAIFYTLGRHLITTTQGQKNMCLQNKYISAPAVDRTRDPRHCRKSLYQRAIRKGGSPVIKSSHRKLYGRRNDARDENIHFHVFRQFIHSLSLLAPALFVLFISILNINWGFISLELSLLPLHSKPDLRLVEKVSFIRLGYLYHNIYVVCIYLVFPLHIPLFSL